MINITIYRNRDGNLVAHAVSTVIAEPYQPSEEVELFTVSAQFDAYFLELLKHALYHELPSPLKPE